MIVFVITCALVVGAILVYAKNNIKAPEPEVARPELSEFGSQQAESQLPSQAQNVGKIQTMQNITELKIEDVKVGTGSGVKNGDQVEVHYLGTLLDGRKFDSSYDRNQTFSFRVGAGEVIAGWDKGLIDMKTGGKRKLYIPSDLAYGPQGNGPIPPNTPLYFEIELVSIKAP